MKCNKTIPHRYFLNCIAIIVLLLVGCAPSATVSQRKCTPLSHLYKKGTGIAVWDFEIRSSTGDVHMNRFLPNRIRKSINKEGHFNLIDRDHLLLSLKELNLGTSLLADEKTRLRLAENIGVKLMVYGEVVQAVGNKTLIQLRLFEVETRTFLSMVQKLYDSSSSDELRWLKDVEDMTPDLFTICQ